MLPAHAGQARSERHFLSTKMPICPACHSRKIRKSSWHPGDGYARLLFFHAYRCRDCQEKIWRVRPLKAAVPAAMLTLVALLAWQLVRPPKHHAGAGAPSAFATLLARAQAGDAAAQLDVAARYREGDGVIQNDRLASQWLAKAAARGGAQAEFEYGRALLNGRGVVQDYRAAFQWISKAAHQGYAPAQYQLGQMYQFGTGTAMNKAQAYLWYNVAAAQGVEQAARSRDGVVWQLSADQVQAMQAEALKLFPAAGAQPAK